MVVGVPKSAIHTENKFMKLTLQRLTGFIAIAGGLLLIGMCSMNTYQAFYGGNEYRVVMPRGAAGVTPGAPVKYRGVDVGVVRTVRPLLSESDRVQREAWRTYHTKKKRLRKISQNREHSGIPETKNRTDPKAGMAIARILLRQPSLPVHKNTFAGGSAYYMTGQGYITIRNPRHVSTSHGRELYLPSFIRQFWQERYLDLMLGFEPVFHEAARFQTKLDRWYFGDSRTDSKSGRDQLRDLSSSLIEQRETSESLKHVVQNTGTAMTSADHSLTQLNQKLDQILHALSSGRKSTGSSTGQQFQSNRSTRSLSNTLHTLDHLLQNSRMKVNEFEYRTLQKGLIENVQN